jgi:Ca-activated chloride channel family protein
VSLRPDAYHAQVAGYLAISFELHSQHALRDFEVVGKTYQLTVRERSPILVKGTFEGRNVTFQEDFAVKYGFDQTRSDSLEVLTYRNPQPAQPAPTETAPVRPTDEPGFFQASALFSSHNPSSAAGTSLPATAGGAPRTVITLFDTSLSMQWEKLDRSFHGLETLLRSLRPADRFNLLLFNTDISSFEKQPVAADQATIEKALEFVRKNGLRGGTNLEQALDAALTQAAGSGGERYLVLLSDGDATRGTINNGKLGAWYSQKWKALPEGERPRTYVFAVGDDANMPLLRMLGRNAGIVEWVRSTEPLDFKLSAFLNKVGSNPLAELRLTTTPSANFDLVYPFEDVVFPGSMGSWVGQYKKPGPPAQFTVQGLRESHAVELRATVPLPAQNLAHPNLPRTWARARVDALLAKIEREGEDRASVDEIIRLARKYKFVTPYTSFLAVPRALLRPRVIRPGDPVLRVKTDPSIISVVALFPFGLIKRLRFLSDEDIWQTRFLAPTEMSDGTYNVRLILRDRLGHVYRESKSFVIASKPPVVRVKLEKKQIRRGETLRLRVNASNMTRTVVARMYGVAPAYLVWDQRAGSITGELSIPADLPAGQYKLTVTAEDLAHNIGSEEVLVEVVP